MMKFGVMPERATVTVLAVLIAAGVVGAVVGGLGFSSVLLLVIAAACTIGAFRSPAVARSLAAFWTRRPLRWAFLGVVGILFLVAVFGGSGSREAVAKEMVDKILVERRWSLRSGDSKQPVASLRLGKEPVFQSGRQTMWKGVATLANGTKLSVDYSEEGNEVVVFVSYPFPAQDPVGSLRKN